MPALLETQILAYGKVVGIVNRKRSDQSVSHPSVSRSQMHTHKLSEPYGQVLERKDDSQCESSISGRFPREERLCVPPKRI
jgi:hypothetical protein